MCFPTIIGQIATVSWVALLFVWNTTERLSPQNVDDTNLSLTSGVRRNMRFIAVLSLALHSFFASAQWTRVHPSSPIQRYLAHAFVAQPDRWIAVGNDMASSSNKGTTWNTTSTNTLPVYLKPDQKYTDIFFKTGQTGFIAFENSIYKTSDGGAHWEKVISLNAIHSKYQYSAFFHAITFSDANNGWAVGDFRKIFRTTDGGSHWEEISWSSSTAPYIAYTDVHFINASTGFIAGYEVSDILMNFGFEEFILRTDDGGQHWERQLLPTNSDFRIIDVSFHDAGNGYAHLRRSQSTDEIYITKDGGGNWIERTPAALRAIQTLEMLPDGRGFAFGKTHDYRIRFVRTSDYGETWTTVAVPLFDQQDEFAISDITFEDDSHGFAVGAGGNILVTTDGGVTWELSNAGYPAFLSFDFIGDNTGYASSGKGFFKTIDRGLHWNYQPHSDSLTIYDMKFEDEARGTFYGWRNFYYSVKNHGTSVARLHLPVNFISLSSFQQNADSLFASGTALAPRRSVLLRSGNGGIDWSTTDIPNVSGLIIQMERNGNHFYYSDGASIFRSSTSGTGWTTLGAFTGDYINGIIVLDDESILASFQSGKVKRLDGDHWNDVADFSPGQAVDFVAKGEYIFAYGNVIDKAVPMGAIWRSTDLGSQWQQEHLPITDFGIQDMDIEGDTAWATGGYGQIFALELGGRITGNEEESYNGALSVYPVPTKEILFIETENENLLHVELLTTTGVSISPGHRLINPFKWEVNVSDLTRGIYMVKVQTTRGWRRMRVVKQ